MEEEDENMFEYEDGQHENPQQEEDEENLGERSLHENYNEEELEDDEVKQHHESLHQEPFEEEDFRRHHDKNTQEELQGDYFTNRRGNQDEQEGDDGYGEEDDSYLSENELNIIQQVNIGDGGDDNEVHDVSHGGRAYQSELSKPIGRAGGIELSIAKAKLFGLLDENGQLKLPRGNIGSSGPNKEKVKALSKPRDIDPDEIYKEPPPTFKPAKSSKAMAAMNDKGCGYDFIERLNNGSDFMTRLEGSTNGKKGLPQSELDRMQEDYNASHDKLQCPQCKKPQSFDEYFEKKRICSQCKKRFEKLNITSGVGFLKREEEQKAARLEKLKKIEEEMYRGTSSAGKSVVKPVLSLRERQAKETAEKQHHAGIAQKPPSQQQQRRPNSAAIDTTTAGSSKQRDNHSEGALDKNSSTSQPQTVNNNNNNNKDSNKSKGPVAHSFPISSKAGSTDDAMGQFVKVNAEKSAQSKALLEKLSKQVEDYGKPALAAHTDKANMTTGNKKGGDDKIAEKLKRGLL